MTSGAPPVGPTLYPRHLVAELEDALASARVVNIVGPRQVGKTTLVPAS